MELNIYVMEAIARQELAERRISAMREGLARAAARPRRPVRLALGLALIRLGTLTLGPHRPLAPRAS
jgi:hypothetical protein